MATLRTPTDAWVSPQDATQARANTATEILSDDHGNSVHVDELSGARPANRIGKQVREYPKETP